MVVLQSTRKGHNHCWNFMYSGSESATYMEFLYQALSCIIERAFEKNHFSCFNIHFVNINFRANFYTFSLNSGEKHLNIYDPNNILVVNDLFLYLWLYKKFAKIKDIQKSLDFVITNLTVVFDGFLLQPTNLLCRLRYKKKNIYNCS